MAISWFCQWDAKDGTKPVLDEHDHQGLVALLRGCPGLIEGHVMTPVQAHDPHYAADLHTSPALVLQLEFAEIADLEQALRPHGYLQALAHDDLLPSLARCGREPPGDADAPLSGGGARALTRRTSFSATWSNMPGRRRTRTPGICSMSTGHPPLLAKFPGIRKIEIYTPATVISALPFAVRRDDAAQQDRVRQSPKP